MQYIIKSLFIFSIILSTAYAASTETEAKTGHIKGKVTTADGLPAGYVNVGIKSINRGTIAEANGSYHIIGIFPGKYTLKVSYLGLQTQETEVVIEAGKTLVVNLVLKEDAKQLSNVVIVANKNNQQVSSIGKSGISPMDLPQSMQIIGKDVIAQQQAIRLSDVVKNVNGIALGTTRGTTSESFVSRGYALGSNNYFKNGSRFNSGTIPEVSTLERVEVLKGSSAMLFGNVSGGSIINLVTKKPEFNYGGEISFRGGSYDAYKPTGDIYGPITKNVAFRLIGTYENNGSYRSNVSSKRYYINPSLLYNINKKTELLVQADYLNYDITPDFGIGSLNNTIPTSISRSSFFNTPWAYNNADQITTSATVNHTLNDNWKLNFVGSYENFDRDYYSTERIQADAVGDWSRKLSRSIRSENYFVAQANLTGKLKTGKLEHTVLVGTDAESSLNKIHTFNFNSSYDKINILDPSKYQARTDMPYAKDSLITETPVYRLGYYVQDMVSLTPKLKVLAGLRWSYQKAITPDIKNLVYGGITKSSTEGQTDKAFSPRFGVVYQPSNITSLFASYSNNFTINKGNDIYGGALSPSLIDQYEIGIKNDLLKGKLAVNFTIYRIINNNLAQQAEFLSDGNVNNNVDIKELTGKTTSDGFEIDLSGTVIGSLNFLAGYSYNFMRYSATSGLNGSYIIGERLVNNPAHTANGSLFYTFKTSKLKGLQLGASAFYTGNRNAGWNNKVGQSQSESRIIPLSGFSTFDATVGYDFGKLSVLGRFSNITNELNYYVHENYSVNPIAPRQFITTLSYKF